MFLLGTALYKEAKRSRRVQRECVCVKRKYGKNVEVLFYSSPAQRTDGIWTRANSLVRTVSPPYCGTLNWTCNTPSETPGSGFSWSLKLGSVRRYWGFDIPISVPYVFVNNTLSAWAVERRHGLTWLDGQTRPYRLYWGLRTLIIVSHNSPLFEYYAYPSLMLL